MIHSQVTHWKKKKNTHTKCPNCFETAKPPRNQSPCEYSTLDLTGIRSELRTVQICAVLECKSWSEGSLPQNNANSKPQNEAYYTNKEGTIGLLHAQKLLYIDHHWPMIWSASFPLQKREMRKRPYPFQDLTLDGNGRPSWLALLGLTNLKDLKGANLSCR